LGKRPADQFYYGDYLRDTRALSLTARGAWMDILCSMHFSDPRGRLSMTVESYSNLLGADFSTTSSVLLEIVALKVADCIVDGRILNPELIQDYADPNNLNIRVVTNHNGRVTLVNRRMDKEEKVRNQGRLRQDRYRTRRSSDAEITPYSSSSVFLIEDLPDFQEKSGHDSGHSYTTKKGRKIEGVLLSTFEEFWTAFGFKQGKAESADAWIELARLFGRRDFVEVKVPLIIQAARIEARRRPAMEAQGKTPKWAQGWLSSRRFEDEFYKGFGGSGQTPKPYDTRPGEESPIEKVKRWRREMEEEEERETRNQKTERGTDEREGNETDD